MNATSIEVTSATKDSPGAGQITIIANYSTVDYPQPAQRQTISDLPSGNARWYRNMRLTDQGLFCTKNGVTPVILTLASWAKIAYTLVTGMTWAPKITTQPSAGSCVASSTAANFTTAVSTEPTASYQWKYETKATGTVTTDNTELADGDTVTVNGQVYRFKDTPVQAFDVKRDGTTADTTLLNFIKAINASGTPGTEYFAGTTAHPTVQADTAVASHVVTLRSRLSGTAGNALTLAKSAAHLSVSGATFTGGGTWNNASGTVLGCAYTNGTTATLTATPTTTAQSGTNHKCTVTNSAGSTDTDSALLTIT